MTAPRIAANPIPYWARDGKTREVFDERVRATSSEIGFTAVKADVPGRHDRGRVREVDRRIRPGARRSACSTPRSTRPWTWPTRWSGPRRFAETQVGARARSYDDLVDVDPGPDGANRPSAPDFDEGRLARAIDNCGAVCRVLQAEGLRPLHHSHVGGVFETEYEITRLLDDLGPGVIGFGPDTGHLRWAGIDPAPFIRRYADRIGGIHIKDCFPDFLTPDSRAGMSYHEVQGTKRLWAEPGRGVVDFAAVLAAIPAGLRRRLHDRGGRAERGVAAGVAPHLVRVGRPQPAGADRMTMATTGTRQRAARVGGADRVLTDARGRRASSASSWPASTPTGAACACWCRTAPGSARCRCWSARCTGRCTAGSPG